MARGQVGIAGAVVLAAALGSTTVARADQGGVSFWVPGIYASMAAVPPDPGFSMPSTFYFYSGKAGGSDEFGIGGLIAGKVEAKGIEAVFLAPTWVPETPVANGRLALTMMGVVANNEVEARVDFDRLPISLQRTDDTFGVGDLYPMASISWNSGVNNYKLYATGDIPVGDYDPRRLANIGIGHAAIDGGGAYTYFNPETGHELSATLGFTYNFENDESQDYKNGIDMHLDWGISQFLTKEWQLGFVGYFYDQISCDSGGGDRVGCFESRVIGVGPQVGHIFKISDDYQGYVNLKGYKEFDAAHRPDGWNVWATLVISPAEEKKPPETKRPRIMK
jgi:hypothetical protein